MLCKWMSKFNGKELANFKSGPQMPNLSGRSSREKPQTVDHKVPLLLTIYKVKRRNEMCLPWQCDQHWLPLGLFCWVMRSAQCSQFFLPSAATAPFWAGWDRLEQDGIDGIELSMFLECELANNVPSFKFVSTFWSELNTFLGLCSLNILNPPNQYH